MRGDTYVGKHGLEQVHRVKFGVGITHVLGQLLGRDTLHGFLELGVSLELRLQLRSDLLNIRHVRVFSNDVLRREVLG